MRYLIIIITLLTLSTAMTAQVKLQQMERSAVKYDLPVAKRTIGVTPGYFQTYMTLPDLIDSLGITLGTVDSIYLSNDTIYLRDGAGFVKLPTGGGGVDSIYLQNDTIFLRDGSGFVDLSGLSSFQVKGTGTPIQVPYFVTADSLSSNVNLRWDTTNLALLVRDIPLGRNALHQFYVGSSAGNGATGATYSNFFGFQAGSGATFALQSNFFGLLSGRNATNASYCNFFGREAGDGATNVTQSNFFGYLAGDGATGASRSNFFGQRAGQSASSAAESNFFGDRAGFNAFNATGSNFFGLSAGEGATDASYSNFFGKNSGNSSQNASYSNFFGYNTGHNLIGTNNILIGKSVTLPDNYENSMNIGGVLFGTGFYNSETKSDNGNAGGRIGILDNNPQRTLHVTGEARITDLVTDTPTRIVGADADGDLGELKVGNGLVISNDSLIVTVSGGGDDWGSQVVESDITLLGDGTSGNILKVDTSIIATQHDLTTINTDSQNLSHTVSGTDRTINISGGTGTTISVADNDNSTSNELITAVTSGLFGTTGATITITEAGVQRTGIVTNMVGATASTNGDQGLVPRPLISNRLQFLRGDGTWSTPTSSGMTNWNLGINNTSYTTVNDGNNVSLNAGSNITLSKSGNTITMNASSPQTWADLGADIVNWGATSSANSGKYVGIGTLSPLSVFHVNGNSTLAGVLYNSASAAGTSGQVLISQGPSSPWTWSNNDASTTNELNTSVTVTHAAGNVLPRVRVTDAGGTLEGLVPFFSQSNLNAGVVPGTNGASNTNFLRADGQWAVPAGIQYTAGTGISISANTITNTGDLSTTNELQNLSYGTKSGNSIPLDISSGSGVNIDQGEGVVIDRTSSNVITIHNVTSHYGQLSNSGFTELNQSLTTSYQKIDFASSQSNVITTSAINDNITVLATGRYEVTLNVCARLPSGVSDSDIIFQMYVNNSSTGLGVGYYKLNNLTALDTECGGKSIIVALNANDVVDWRFQRAGGNATDIDWFAHNFSIKRIE